MRGENWRFWLPVGVLALFTAYVSYRLVSAHVDPSVESINYTFERDLPAVRGAIYDCFGEKYPLAKSIPIWEYHLDPVTLTNRVVRRKGEPRRPKAAIVKTISTALGLDFKKTLEMSEDVRRRYQFLAVSSDPDAHDTLINTKLVAGVAIDERQRRKYMLKPRFAHVLGSVNACHVGSAGIEQKYEKTLSGVPGRIRGMKDAHGRELYDKRIVSIAPIPGADIHLTVDHNIQYDVETMLGDGIAEFGAGSGWCVVMDAKSAAVLALASYPDFYPPEFGQTPDAAKVNQVCAFTYEPGSVMKVITAAAGIDSGRVTPATMYSTRRDDDRYYRLPGDGSHKWEPLMSVKDAIVHSSNIVIGKLGCDIGPAKLYEYMREFGFGQKTGIELPGEETGILPHWKKWDKVKWSRAPIGQGVAVTAIQLASAYQAIANDGVRMRPHIVSKIVDSSGEIVYRHEDKVVSRPITSTAARQIRNAMLGVASPDGTARRAAIKGYSVAGKTGTAQKVINGKYSDHLFRATFCGMVPASDPQFVILVTLDFDERRLYHQGGNSAGPIFRRIANAVLRYKEVTPDRQEELEETDKGSEELEEYMENRARGERTSAD